MRKQEYCMHFFISYFLLNSSPLSWFSSRSAVASIMADSVFAFLHSLIWSFSRSFPFFFLMFLLNLLKSLLSQGLTLRFLLCSFYNFPLTTSAKTKLYLVPRYRWPLCLFLLPKTHCFLTSSISQPFILCLSKHFKSFS